MVVEHPEPPVPADCVPVWLVDAEGEVLEGEASGLVRCPDPNGGDAVDYRTAPVSCRDIPGSDCLCDADCPQGYDCICANTSTSLGLGGTPTNVCYPSDCERDQDCDSGRCRMDVFSCGSGHRSPCSLRCTSRSDDCLFHTECDDGTFCDYDTVMELFTCEPGAFCE